MQKNNTFSLVRFWPWMGGNFIPLDAVEEQYLAPLPSAEERWKKTQVMLRKLEHDWKHRKVRLQIQRKRRKRWIRIKLGMRLLNLSHRA